MILRRTAVTSEPVNGSLQVSASNMVMPIAEEVRARVDEGVSAGLLGRGIARSAIDTAALPGTLVGGRGVGRAHAKVEKVHVELSVAASVEQDVLGLDVPVDVTMPMHAVQNRRQPRHDDRNLPRVERPAPSQYEERLSERMCFITTYGEPS